MVDSNQKEPKRRILDAAIPLFAQRGFAAVGVREIASAADVNVSMISYYFGGKAGILKAIIAEFYDQHHRLIEQANDEGTSPEECLRALVCRMVDFVRANTELSMIIFNTLPLDIPEITSFKAEKIPELLREAGPLIEAFNLDPNDAVQMSIIGPALFSIISAHFRFKPVQERVFGFQFGDTFYERYAETLTNLFLYGVTGMVAPEEK